MENKVLKLGGGGERSTQDVSATIPSGSSERWSVQSQKIKYVNGKMSGVSGVGYTASINNSDYLLEEDKSKNLIQITAQNEGTSGICVLTQKESGNKINLNITTPDYWEIRFTPLPFYEGDASVSFVVHTNISGEEGGMDEGGTLYRNWIVNQNRYVINVHITYPYPTTIDTDLLSWVCLDRNGNAFHPSYNLPSNSYLTTKQLGFGAYALTLTNSSTPPNTNDDALVLSSRFNPTKKYPLDLNFYWTLYYPKSQLNTGIKIISPL